MSEQLSALMDGELTPDEMKHQISALKKDSTLNQTWAAYHMLGDAMRKSPHLSVGFTAKLARQLAEEPTILAPRRAPQSNPPRYVMPIAASVAAVSMVGVLTWQMMQVNKNEAPISIATAPLNSLQNVAVTTPQQVMPARLVTPAANPTHPETVQFSRVVSNPYLLAHQEFSPSYAREGIPAYVRTVSEHQDSVR